MEVIQRNEVVYNDQQYGNKNLDIINNNNSNSNSRSSGSTSESNEHDMLRFRATDSAEHRLDKLLNINNHQQIQQRKMKERYDEEEEEEEEERDREPSMIQPVVRGIMLQIPKRHVDIELTCPVCLGILKQTEVSPCMHRFCAECIQKCLRLRYSHCPTCRIHLSSRRTLKRDKAFDDMIQSIYPDMNTFEEEEKVFLKEASDRYKLVSVDHRERFKRKRAQRRDSDEENNSNRDDEEDDDDENNSDEEDDRSKEDEEEEEEDNNHRIRRRKSSSSNKSQSMQRANSINNKGSSQKERSSNFGRYPEPIPMSQLSIAATFTDDGDIMSPNQMDMSSSQKPPSKSIRFALKRHPLEYNLPDLKEKFLVTSPRLSTLHIKKFLAFKFGLSNPHDLEIWYTSPSFRPYLLKDSFTLLDMVQTWENGDASRRLFLVYRAKGN